jgi:anion-transporting  ArsA/GET3 family ATPase
MEDHEPVCSRELISTDPAHSLSDAFRMTFSHEPTVIPEAPNLSWWK